MDDTFETHRDALTRAEKLGWQRGMLDAATAIMDLAPEGDWDALLLARRIIAMAALPADVMAILDGADREALRKLHDRGNGEVIHHIDGDPSNNDVSNLRVVSAANDRP